MTYKVTMTSAARRALHRLPVEMATAIAAQAEGPIAENPHRLGKELDPPYEGVWSARRGPYRILYTIDDTAGAITIMAIGHRSDVYRSR